MSTDGQPKCLMLNFCRSSTNLVPTSALFAVSARRALRAVVSEVCSPPRVTALAKLCPEYGVLPGFAFDLTTHDQDGRAWDFDDKEMQRRAWAKIEREKPLLIVGSPMCTVFSP